MPGRHLRQQRKRKAAAGDAALGAGASDFGGIPPQDIPHEAITDPPSPEASADMAAGGLPVVRGNSIAAPLTPTGRAQVQKTGQELAAAGGVDQIVPSDSKRTMQTAQAIQGADPNRPPISPDPGLQSQPLGGLEGEAKTPGVRRFLQDLVRKSPNTRIPGQGALSSRPGESSNEFRVRALSAVRGIMQQLAQNPNQTIAVPKHSSVSKLVHAWVANGTPDDLSIDANAYINAPEPAPGSVEKFSPDADGRWQMSDFNPAAERELPKGAILFIEHGQTPTVQKNSLQVSTQAKHRAQIIAAIRSGDWRAAKKAAMAASGAGLQDPEISSAIDEALPSAEQAGNVPPHELLAMISAASPAKRAELMPVWQKVAGDFSGVSPDGVNALKTHLGRLA